MAIEILDKQYGFEDVSRVLTVPDCNVLGPNKLGTGHGESKFYFGTKEELTDFFTLHHDTAECFFLRSDLLAYLLAIKMEYEKPTQHYAGVEQLPTLWTERYKMVSALPEFIPFTVRYQNQIEGPRGYLNSNDEYYKLFRILSLPLVSYLSIMRLKQRNGSPIYYWKLFVDFEAIWQRKCDPLVFTYGHPTKTQKAEGTPQAIAKAEKIAQAGRKGQQDYRNKLLSECPFCPITGLADDRLLIASHIKPYAACDNETEQYDPNNGFIFSPLYDKLFDQGFLSFSNDRKMKVSMWLSQKTQKICNIQEGTFVQQLPLNDKRAHYLDYHRKYVFKG